MRRPGGFRFLLMAGACLLLLPLKMIQGWNAESGVALLSSWAADTCFLLWLHWLGVAAGGRTQPRKLLLGGLVFLLVQLPALLTITAHSFYLEEATARQFSPLDLSWDAVSFFLWRVVPPRMLVACAAILAGLAVGAFFLQRRVHIPPTKPMLWTVGVLSLAVLIHQAFCTFYPSVLWEGARDVAEAFSHPVAGGPPTNADLAGADRGRPADWSAPPLFDKVLVLVMESVPLRELKEKTAHLPADHFFNRHREHIHSYENYFTTNQDSRTGLLAMLVGRPIPFEAYTERDALRYLFLRSERSLVDRLTSLGYATAVAAAQTDIELVVFELPWRKRIVLSNEEFENHGHFLCFNPYEFEHDCEDKILLPRIFAELDAKQRVFVFQEGVFGHISDYSDATGKSSVQYYGEHLQAIVDHLRERGTLEQTLIVVTSDHGIRDWDYRRRRWVYRLPLLFMNPGFARRQDPGLYNQADFSALLAAELSGRPGPAPRRISTFVGCTNSSLLGSVTAEGDLLVVKNRRFRQYVLADGSCPDDDTPQGPPRRPVGPAALIEFFARSQSTFNHEQFGRDAGP